MIEVRVERADPGKTKGIHPAVRAHVARELELSMIALQSHIQTAKLSGQVLHRRSGDLSEAIWPEVKEDKGGLLGRVFVRPNAWYGRIHEYGGTFNIPAHRRTMTKIFGQPVVPPKTVQVRAHTATFPERSFLRSALVDMKSFILDRIHKGFRTGMMEASNG